MSELLKRANDYVQSKIHEKQDIYRPDFHFTSICGWINDPNGFVYYDGQYHLFYQHYPFGTVWGPMHWGHAASRDLVKWSHLPIAMAPDMPYDKDGCFSGSAIERDGKLNLLYTGNVHLNEDRVVAIQQQCLSISEDGVNFTKHGNNPVIKSDFYTEETSLYDFRDPRVLKWGDKYLCVVGSKTKDDLGQLLLFESRDLVNWAFKSVMIKGDERFGTMWECPDMFHLDGKDVIIISPMAMAPQGNRYKNISSSIWIIGTFDSNEGKFTMESYGEIDHGFDFYAPQTTASPDGKRLMIPWLEIWGHPMPTHEMGLDWTGAMGIPRELSIVGNELVQRPTENIEKYCELAESLRDIESEEFNRAFRLDKSMRLRCSMKVSEDTDIKFEIYDKNSEHIILNYKNKEFSMYRDGSKWLEASERKTDISTEDGSFKIDIILDRSALEVYLQDGRHVMSARVYPDDTASLINLCVTGKTYIENIECFGMELNS